MSNATENRITMYGAEWCGDCRRSKAFLDYHEVDYDYVDLEANPDQAEVAQTISGRKNIPVISFPDGSFQVEPSDADLKAKLDELGALEAGKA